MDLSFLILTLVGAGVVAGFLAGLLGIGGGIITIPVLFTVFSQLDVDATWRVHMSVATSLAIIVATSLSSVRAHHARGNVDWPLIKSWAVLMAVGSMLGSRYAQTLKGDWLIYGFIGLAVLLAIKMILPLDQVRLKGRPDAGLQGRVAPSLIGFLAAILGIGGGSFTVPFLTLHGMVIQRAVGTSAFLGLIISVFGGAGYLIATENSEVLAPYTVGLVHLPSFAVLAVTTSLTAPFGAQAAQAVSKRTLSIVFGIFLIIAVVRLASAL